MLRHDGHGLFQDDNGWLNILHHHQHAIWGNFFFFPKCCLVLQLQLQTLVEYLSRHAMAQNVTKALYLVLSLNLSPICAYYKIHIALQLLCILWFGELPKGGHPCDLTQKQVSWLGCRHHWNEILVSHSLNTCKIDNHWEWQTAWEHCNPFSWWELTSIHLSPFCSHPSPLELTCVAITGLELLSPCVQSWTIKKG